MGLAHAFLTRLTWLVPFMGGLLVSATVMSTFEALLHSEVQLSFFLPLIIGHAGNAGGQTVSTVVRALGNGDTHCGEALRVTARESAMGLALSAALAVCLIPYFVFARIDQQVSIVVVLTILILGSLANMFSAWLPFAVSRVGADPAVIVAPLMTTVTDVLGIFIYLSLARLVMDAV